MESGFVTRWIGAVGGWWWFAGRNAEITELFRYGWRRESGLGKRVSGKRVANPLSKLGGAGVGGRVANPRSLLGESGHWGGLQTRAPYWGSRGIGAGCKPALPIHWSLDLAAQRPRAGLEM